MRSPSRSTFFVRDVRVRGARRQCVAFRGNNPKMSSKSLGPAPLAHPETCRSARRWECRGGGDGACVRDLQPPRGSGRYACALCFSPATLAGEKQDEISSGTHFWDTRPHLKLFFLLLSSPDRPRSSSLPTDRLQRIRFWNTGPHLKLLFSRFPNRNTVKEGAAPADRSQRPSFGTLEDPI